MTPQVTGALIGAGGGVLQSILGIGQGRRNERRNKRLMQHELNLNKQMFDYQNVYNLPKNQMQRLKDAGLNPALMYGQGTTGNASNYPQTSRTPTEVSAFDATGAISGITSAAQTILQQQQTDNLKAQEKETDSRTMLNTIEAAVKGGTMKEAKGLVRYQLENLKSDNKNKLQSLKNLGITEGILNANRTEAQVRAEDAKIQKAMNQLDLNAMEKSRISRLDNAMFKLFWRIGGETKEAFEYLIKDILKNTHKIPLLK